MPIIIMKKVTNNTMHIAQELDIFSFEVVL